jgi:hypothetical protein
VPKVDVNESNWVFIAVDRVGNDGNQQVSALTALVGDDRRRSYCGRAADGNLTCNFGGERAGAEPYKARSVGARGCPPPFEVASSSRTTPPAGLARRAALEKV